MIIAFTLFIVIHSRLWMCLYSCSNTMCPFRLRVLFFRTFFFFFIFNKKSQWNVISCHHSSVDRIWMKKGKSEEKRTEEKQFIWTIIMIIMVDPKTHTGLPKQLGLASGIVVVPIERAVLFFCSYHLFIHFHLFLVDHLNEWIGIVWFVLWFKRIQISCTKLKTTNRPYQMIWTINLRYARYVSNPYIYAILCKKEKQKPNLTKWKHFIRIVLVIPKNMRNTAVECNIYYENDKQKMVWSQKLPIPFNYNLFVSWENVDIIWFVVQRNLVSVGIFVTHQPEPGPVLHSFLFLFSPNVRLYIFYLFKLHPSTLSLFISFVAQTMAWIQKVKKDEYTWLFDVSNLIKIKNGSAKLKWGGTKIVCCLFCIVELMIYLHCGYNSLHRHCTNERCN